MTLSELEFLHSKVMQMDCQAFEAWLFDYCVSATMKYEDAYDEGYRKAKDKWYDKGYGDGYYDGSNE